MNVVNAKPETAAIINAHKSWACPAGYISRTAILFRYLLNNFNIIIEWFKVFCFVDDMIQTWTKKVLFNTFTRSSSCARFAATLTSFLVTFKWVWIAAVTLTRFAAVFIESAQSIVASQAFVAANASCKFFTRITNSSLVIAA